MSKATYKNVGAYVCTSFDCDNKDLSVCVVGAAPDARLSIGGIFVPLTDTRAKIKASELEDGIHTLFIHTDGESRELGRMQKEGGIIKRYVCEKEFEALVELCVRSYDRLNEAEEKIKALEMAVFNSFIF